MILVKIEKCRIFVRKQPAVWACLYEIYNMMNMNSHYTYIDIYVFIHKIYTEEGFGW